jgi:hypothetical protein
MPFSFSDGDLPPPPNPQLIPSIEQQLLLHQQLQPLQPQPLNAPDISSSRQQQPFPQAPTPTSSLDVFNDATSANSAGVTDRAELIERIKAGQKTQAWIPDRNVHTYVPLMCSGGV